MYHEVPDLTTVWTDGSRAAGFEDHEQAVRAYWETIEHLNFVVQSPEVQVLSPDLAVVTFRHSSDVQFKEEGSRETYAGHGTMVWMKDAEDGLWKIHTQHVSRNPS
jgi:ketosteroid isomerase-like protein